MSEKKKLQRTVLVDTSFLIYLGNKEAGDDHKTAKKYYDFFLKNNIVMKLSPIVVAEFHQVQSIADLMQTDNFQVLPFNYEDGLRSANVAYELGGTTRGGRDKDNIKYMDDIKILGQAANNDIDFLITHDKSTLAKYCTKLHKSGMIKTEVIVINEPFDGSIFNGGQSALDLDRN